MKVKYPRIKKVITTCSVLLLVLFALSFSAVIHVQGAASESLNTVGVVNWPQRTQPQLRLISLNIAHGRGDGFSQIFQSKQRIQKQLQEVTNLIQTQQVDMLALQEIDGLASWSGNVNQVEKLAEEASFTQHVRGEHVKGLGLSYGTALLSKGTLSNATSCTFPHSAPTFSKGFVVATINFPGAEHIELDVVSLHLDFARDSVRKKQLQHLRETLKERDRPLIILGDFNCNWQDETSSLRQFAQEMNLSAFEPDDETMISFETTGERLDWVLISDEFEFIDYKTLPDVVSDHKAVVTTIGLRK